MTKLSLEPRDDQHGVCHLFLCSMSDSVLVVSLSLVSFTTAAGNTTPNDTSNDGKQDDECKEGVDGIECHLVDTHNGLNCCGLTVTKVIITLGNGTIVGIWIVEQLSLSSWKYTQTSDQDGAQDHQSMHQTRHDERE